jgi:hypothetical protein
VATGLIIERDPAPSKGGRNGAGNGDQTPADRGLRYKAATDGHFVPQTVIRAGSGARISPPETCLPQHVNETLTLSKRRSFDDIDSPTGPEADDAGRGRGSRPPGEERHGTASPPQTTRIAGPHRRELGGDLWAGRSRAANSGRGARARLFLGSFSGRLGDGRPRR